MPAMKHKFLIAMFAVVLATATTFAFALPGPTACLLIGVAELNRLSDGSLTGSELEADQQRQLQLHPGDQDKWQRLISVLKALPLDS